MVLLFSSVHAQIFLLFYHDIVKNTIVFFASSSISSCFSSGLVINIFNIFLNIAFSKISWIFYDLYQPPTNVCIYLVLDHGNSSDDQMITLFTFFLKACGVVGRTARPVGTYVPGGTQTHAFRGHLLYHWTTDPYGTNRLSCHMVELEVSSCLIHYCQLRVIQLVPLVCWRPLTTTLTEIWIFFQGNASTLLMIYDISFSISLTQRL